MSELRDRLLRSLADGLADAEDFEEVSLFTKEELDAPVDVVRGLIPEIGTEQISVLTEFFFMPFEDEDMLYFSSVITVTDEIAQEEVADLSLAVARINFDLPCGSFSVSPDGESLVYKYTVPVPGSVDESIQKDIMLTSIDAAINVVDRFEGYLALALEGNLSTKDLVKLLHGSNTEEESKEEN